MSLRWRIASALAVIAALVGSGAAFGSYLSTSRQLHRELDRSLLQIVDRINPPEQGPGRGSPGPDGTDDIDRRDATQPAPLHREVPTGGPEAEGSSARCPTAALQPSAGAQLVRSDGTAVPCYTDGLALPVDTVDLELARSGGSPRLRSVTIDERQYRMISVVWHHGGLVQAVRGVAESDEILQRLQWRLAALVGAAVLSAAVLGWWFAGQLVRPVERLRAAAERVASTGDLDTSVPATGPGELRSLAASFTTMVGGLATSREQQKRLVADASHELRTPLTSLRTNIELLERADHLPVVQRRELLADVRAELDELTDLVAELVELATDRSGPSETFELVQLADIAEDVATRARRRSGRHIEVRCTDGAELNVVRALLERVVSNLVENALKYSPGDGAVVITVDGARVEVRDHGPGIDPADQPHVFDRFYRSTAARTSAGSGLGLAIVKQIVERHGGRVWAANAVGGGASVGFELPSTRSTGRAERTEVSHAPS